MNKHYHLVGIGGIGMSGIARLLLKRNIKVSGSDLKESRLTDELKKLGAEIYIGHNPINIKGADVVVYSSAIRQNNPEIQEAKKQGLPLLKRAKALADLMKAQTIIAITGSHGKTTTTSLVSYLLLQAGLRPTVAIGGILKNIEAQASLGDGRFFVAEADESDGSFLYYQPKYSIVTNIDYEHLDYYQDFKNEIFAFREFLNRTSRDGCVFCCSDDINLKSILEDYPKRYVLFGLDERADIYPKNIRLEGLNSEFDCFYKNKFIDRFYLSLAGRHNISNALSVIALGIELGIDLKYIKDTLATYKGSARRMDVKFNDNKYLFIDDYAHHPTEIKATLEAIKNLQKKRVIAIFQPHRYSRTKLLLDEFGRCLDLADYIVVTDIYAASEAPQEGITGRLISDKIIEHAPDKLVKFLPKEEIIEHVLGMIEPGDLVITLGAGDINKICDELVERFRTHYL